jgi:prephenate dehydrogenase
VKAEVRAVTIVGLGLIGGSVAKAFRERSPGVRIVAIDRPGVVDAAIQAGVVDAGSEDLSALNGTDVIVLAAPVRQNISLLTALAERPTGSALVTDVGSTKRAIVEAASRLPDRLTFIGGHPLAGAAAGGFEAARADLFRGRPWILTPTSRVADDAIGRLEALVSGLGAVPARMDAADHDRLMAYISHLPQLTVSALMHIVGQRVGAEGLRLAGSGLRDTTRLAASPPGTWRDVTATNVEPLAQAIDDLIAALTRLRADLASGQELPRVFDDAAAWKRSLEQSD